MTDFNHRKYLLNQLENFLHDALHEASPQEIYDVIKKVVEENYYYHKDHSSRSYELLALLNGNGKGHISGYEPKEPLVCDRNDPSPECKGAWDDFWEENYYPEECDTKSTEEEKEVCREYNLREAEYYNKRAQLDAQDKVKKWVLPVEQFAGSEECLISFPDDLLERANLKEGDMVEWIPQQNGSYLLKKTSLNHDEAIKEGWEMTGDGFWVPPQDC